MILDLFDYITLATNSESNDSEILLCKKLVNKIIEQRTLRFQLNELEDDYIQLSESGILFEDGIIAGGKDITIKLNPLVLFELMLHPYWMVYALKTGGHLKQLVILCAR